jgi:type II secretory pathway component PulF
MALGDILLAIINFIKYPAWHLVIFFVILFAIVIYSMLSDWGFTGK